MTAIAPVACPVRSAAIVKYNELTIDAAGHRAPERGASASKDAPRRALGRDECVAVHASALERAIGRCAARVAPSHYVKQRSFFLPAARLCVRVLCFLFAAACPEPRGRRSAGKRATLTGRARRLRTPPSMSGDANLSSTATFRSQYRSYDVVRVMSGAPTSPARRRLGGRPVRLDAEQCHVLMILSEATPHPSGCVAPPSSPLPRGERALMRQGRRRASGERPRNKAVGFCGSNAGRSRASACSAQ